MKRTLFVLALLLVLASPSWATLWYVDNTATGSNNGTSWANAWTGAASIAGLSAGDTVYISGGASGKTYSWPANWVPASGTAGNPITYAVGQDAGHTGTVTFTRSGSTAEQAFILGTNVRYMNITGEVSGQRKMMVDSTYSHFFYALGATDKHISMKYFTSTAGVWHGYGGYYELSYADITPMINFTPNAAAVTHFGETGPTTGYGINSLHHNIIRIVHKHTAGLGLDGIKFFSNTDIHDNTIIGYYDASYTGGEHQDAIQTGANGTTYNRIYNNYFENVSNAAIFLQMFGVSGSTTRVYNNIMNVNEVGMDWGAYACIQVGSSPPGGTLSDTIIANNTCVAGGTQRGIFFNVGNVFTPSSDVYLVNNLIYNALSGETIAGTTTGATVSNNVGGTTNLAFAANAVYPNNNFRLTEAATAAIDAGISPAYLTSVYTTDLFGITRPTGAQWDVGAAELFGNPPPNAPTGLHMAAFTGPTWAVLIWSPNTDADFACYHGYRSLVSGTYSAVPLFTITAASAAAARSPMTQYFDSKLYTAGTYYYKIAACDVDTNISALSSEVSITVTGKQ